MSLQHRRAALSLLMFVGLCLLLGAWAWQAEYNPSYGAKIDFIKYHFTSVALYESADFQTFMREMPTASGPLYYAVMGQTPMPADAARFITLCMHIASTALVLLISRKFINSALWPALLALAFFVSPFQLGPALWGHPEALATLMVFAAVLAQERGWHSLASVLTAMTITCRQTTIALIGHVGLQDLRQRRFAQMGLKAVLALVLLLWMFQHWHGLTPPKFQDHLSPNGRTFLVAFALGCAALLSFEAQATWPGLKQVLTRALIAFPACALLYNLSPGFERGGFLFSLIDRLEAQHQLPMALLSPLALSGMLAVFTAPLKRDPWMLLSMLGCALTLAVSNVYYVKYTDFYAWPLALSLMPTQASDAQKTLRIAKSLVCWSVANLLLVSIRYA